MAETVEVTNDPDGHPYWAHDHMADFLDVLRENGEIPMGCHVEGVEITVGEPIKVGYTMPTGGEQ